MVFKARYLMVGLNDVGFVKQEYFRSFANAVIKVCWMNMQIPTYLVQRDTRTIIEESKLALTETYWWVLAHKKQKTQPGTTKRHLKNSAHIPYCSNFSTNSFSTPFPLTPLKTKIFEPGIENPLSSLHLNQLCRYTNKVKS